MDTQRRLTLRGWIILWAIAAFLSFFHSPPAERFHAFCLVFSGCSFYIAIWLRRWAVGCLGYIAALPLLYLATHLAPLAMIIIAQIIAGGAATGPLILNLAGYTWLVAPSMPAVVAGWVVLPAATVAYSYLQRVRPQLADRAGLVVQGILLLAGVGATLARYLH